MNDCVVIIVLLGISVWEVLIEQEKKCIAHRGY